MRLDSFLKTSRLIKKRVLAKELCEQGAVTLNGSRTKPSKEVKGGDQIVIDSWKKRIRIEALDIPRGNVSRGEARELYRVLEEQSKSQTIEW